MLDNLNIHFIKNDKVLWPSESPISKHSYVRSVTMCVQMYTVHFFDGVLFCQEWCYELETFSVVIGKQGYLCKPIKNSFTVAYFWNKKLLSSKWTKVSDFP